MNTACSLRTETPRLRTQRSHALPEPLSFRFSTLCNSVDSTLLASPSFGEEKKKRSLFLGFEVNLSEGIRNITISWKTSDLSSLDGLVRLITGRAAVWKSGILPAPVGHSPEPDRPSAGALPGALPAIPLSRCPQGEKLEGTKSKLSTSQLTHTVSPKFMK